MVVQLRSYRNAKGPRERRGLWLEVQKEMMTDRKRKGEKKIQNMNGTGRRKQRLRGKQACER